MLRALMHLHIHAPCVAGVVLFDNTLVQTVSFTNPGGSTLEQSVPLGLTCDYSFQTYFVLRFDADAHVHLTMGVNAITPGSTSFSLHLYTVDASHTLSSQLAEFNATTTTGAAAVAYVTFVMSGYTLTAGQTYVMLVAPSSSKYLPVVCY